MKPPRIHNLAIDTTAARVSPSLLVFKHIGDAGPGTLATVGKASMHGVGTELGTDGGLPGPSEGGYGPLFEIDKRLQIVHGLREFGPKLWASVFRRGLKPGARVSG